MIRSKGKDIASSKTSRNNRDKTEGKRKANIAAGLSPAQSLHK